MNLGRRVIFSYRWFRALSLLGAIFFSINVYAQSTDSALQSATLSGLIDYALTHQPTVQQAAINQEITDLQIKNKLADWYPQLNFNYNYQHNFQLPVSIIGGNQLRMGMDNTSSLQFTATQNIFNRDALLASRTKPDVQLLAAKQTESAKISLVASVSKNFYDLLATTEQLKIMAQNIVMLKRSLNDARSRYDAGVTDKTDYQRATIALNNAIASQTQINESLKAKNANIKYLINYPAEKDLTLSEAGVSLESEIYIDTVHPVSFANRVEYQQLQTQIRLQDANVRYNKWSYIPTVSANGAYIRNFLNNEFSKLYNTGYPNSYAALTLGFPIFQGGKRKNNIVIAEKQLKQSELDLVSFKNQASSEYQTAIAQYRTSMANYQALKENMELAKEVNRVIELQYREGIKTYLELITAQTDLRAAQINYFNAIYGLLSSKIDVQKAEGTIHVK